MMTQSPTAEYFICRLAEACDGAHQIDGTGFNRNDTSIGKSLAERARQGLPWSNKQVQVALRLIVKYSRQLGGNDFIKSWMTNPRFQNNFAQDKKSAPMRKLSSMDKQAVFQFTYDPQIVTAIKSIGGEHKGVKFYPRWDGINKYWLLDVNETSIQHIMQVARDWEFEIEDRFEIYYSRVQQKLEGVRDAAEESRVITTLGYREGVHVQDGLIEITHADVHVLAEFQAALARL